MHLSDSIERQLAPLYGTHLATLTARFETALAAAGLDGVAIFAGTETLVDRDDEAYPFRAEPYFRQWLPLPHAVGSVLLVRPGKTPLLIYLQPEDFWHAPPADPEGFWCAHFDLEVARSEAEVVRRLAAAGGTLGAIGRPGAAAHLFERLDDPALLTRLDFDRAAKTAYEIACLRQASAMAVRGHVAAREAFEGGASEFMIHQRYLAAAAQRERALPYNAIVALDRHAAVLHYQHLDTAPPEAGESFLIDAGASFNGYGADITRTWARTGGPFRDLITAMDTLQQQLCRELAPGTDFIALNDRAHELLADVLVEHRLVTCGAPEALDTGLTRVFLPHGLGHLLGLQVHDAGGRLADPTGGQRPAPPEHPFLRLTRVVEEHFVLTIEPGLYFIPSLLRTMSPADRGRIDWRVIERLLPYGGIRVEDDVVVAPGESRNLTREAFAAR